MLTDDGQKVKAKIKAQVKATLQARSRRNQGVMCLMLLCINQPDVMVKLIRFLFSLAHNHHSWRVRNVGMPRAAEQVHI